MVCRARSGTTAPPIGAKLSTDSGISGECLRTGQTQHCSDTESDPRVDVEVCRTLGLRSIAVLPIQGWRGINGIVEVFATKPRAFSAAHIAFLQQLAAVAERARTFQPLGATSDVAKPPVAQPTAQGMLPASDRVRDVAAIFLGGRSRPFMIAGAVLGMALIAFVIWLGWRGPADGSPTSQSDSSVITRVEAASLPTRDALAKEFSGLGGLPLKKSSAGIPVKMASKIDIIPRAKTRQNQPLLMADAAAMTVVPYQATSVSDHETAEDMTSLAETNNQSSALANVLRSPSSTPQLAPSAVSQGVATGRIKRAVPPTYPAQALAMRLQGKVVLEATVFEDGSVHDINVVEGPPLLAKSAITAVERWRYKPYQLNGRPVKTQTTITVEFKLPSETASR
jgi:TonB family protein